MFLGDHEASEAIIQECYVHADEPEDKGNLLRLRSQNHWLRNEFSEALKVTLAALKILGIEVNPSPSRREADVMFELVRNEILAVGFDEISAIPRTTDKRTELAVTLLNDAGMPFSFRPFASQLISLLRHQRILESILTGVHRHHRIDGLSL